MKKQLPTEEIQHLFSFVQSKNVPYRDVQYEIVDHLACAMEDMKEENPEWPYSLCLQQIYKKFPITGFAQLQLEKEEALQKYWKKKLWPYVLEYFKLPKVIFTLLIFFGLQQVISRIEPIEFTLWEVGLTPNTLIYFLILMVFVAMSFFFRKWYNKPTFYSDSNQANSETLLYVKSFNISCHICTSTLMIIPMYISYLILPRFDAFIFHGIHSYLMAFTILAIMINFHLTLNVFPDILENEAEQKYAHIQMKLA